MKSIQLDCLQVARIRRAYIEKKFQLYKLVGDVAYPVRPWMHCPLKGRKVVLSWKEANRNLN